MIISAGLIHEYDFGLSIALSSSPVFIMIGGIQPKSNVSNNIYPNRGFQQTLRYAILLAVIFTLSVFFSSWVEEIIFGVQYNYTSEYMKFYVLGIIVFGGTALAQHMITRLIMARYQQIPLWRYDKFLDHAANDLHILRKVGGGYIFRHRYLLEYFAGKKLE